MAAAGGGGALARAGAPSGLTPGPGAGCPVGIAFNLLDQSTHTSLPEDGLAVCPENSQAHPSLQEHFYTPRRAPAGSRGHGATPVPGGWRGVAAWRDQPGPRP